MNDSETVGGAEVVPESTVKRVRRIEKRHGKNFMEVMCDVHDHVFGATPAEDGPPDTAGDPPASGVTYEEGQPSNTQVDPADPSAQQTSETGSG